MRNKIQFRIQGLTVLIALSVNVAAFQFVPGDVYTSSGSDRVIRQSKPNGVFAGSLTLSALQGLEVRGMAFGPNGLLYTVVARESGFGVLALNSSGTIVQNFSGSLNVFANGSSGKITFGRNGYFFVSGADRLVAFREDRPNQNTIYQDNQVFDSKLLPSGNLLVLSAYQIREITPGGSIVRTITPSILLGNGRGIEFDPVTNSIFVTMLGYTGEQFRLMRLNGTTGEVLQRTTFVYGDDIHLTHDRKLIVGSRVSAPGVFDLNLNPLSSFGTTQQMFVTQMPVPEPSSLLLMSAASLFVIARRRKVKSNEIS